MIRVLFTLLLITILSSPSFAEDKKYASTYDRVMDTHTLRCGYFVWAPYFSVDPNTQQKSGIYYDMIEELGKVLGLKIEWTLEYSLGTQVEALRTNKADALCADGPFTRSAMPYVDYSQPYIFIPGYVYTLKTNKKASDFKRLNSEDVTFTMIDGDGSAEYIQLYFPKAKVMSMPSTSDASQLGQNIITGKADAMFNDPISLTAYPKEDREKIKAVKQDPTAILPMLISVNKGQDELLHMLNQGIDLMNDAGIIDHVLNKYDPKNELLKRPQKRYR